MRYKRLEDYIATLSENEKQQYKHLIEESMLRRSEIKKNSDSLRENLDALFDRLSDSVEAMNVLGIQVRQLKVNMLRLNLRYSKAVFLSEHSDRDLLQHYPKSFN
ncbi:MAG: hypothetical protein ABSB95_09655 [Dissulfurispiraceae bacterium]|jgi:hypothetical protein